MTRDDDQSAGTAMVRRACEALHVHVRLMDQAHHSDALGHKLVQALPTIAPFPGRRYNHVHAVLDWDHKLPSEHVFLRIIASYTESTTRDLKGRLDAIEADINETNLFPEFDLPDFADVEGDECYVAVMKPGDVSFGDLRFVSHWRRQIPPEQAERALELVQQNEVFRAVEGARQGPHLGGPVLVGWTPPAVAQAEHWSIETWLLTEFNGQSGRAHVFMVDTHAGHITRTFETDVHVS